MSPLRHLNTTRATGQRLEPVSRTVTASPLVVARLPSALPRC